MSQLNYYKDTSSGFYHKSLNRRSFLRTGVISATAGVLAGSSCLNVLAQDIRLAGISGIVETRSGKMSGIRFDGDVDAFYGIPYAAPTGGNARFMKPAKPALWRGVREMTSVANRSPQDTIGPLTEVESLDRRETMGEDCLNLNVFTPGSDGNNRPVMVWLHGGGFSSGSGGWLLYDGTNLARSQDVVVVTVNHRLNVFGYLHLAELGGEKYADSGNAGMLDIIAALQWVRDNIAAFGGDPGSVTIFGQSGGGGKVSTLLAMPEAKGLFHKAIAMSGSNVRGTPMAQGTEIAERLLAALELRPNQLDRLQAMPMQQLLDTFLGMRGLRMAPVVDGLHLPRDPFYPDAPGLSTDIPMLLSTTEHEVNFSAGTPLDDFDNSSLQQRVKQTIGTSDNKAKELIDVYRTGRPDISNVELFQILASDNSFRRGVMTQAALKADQHAAPVYMYYFRWNSSVRQGRLRAYHCLDIPFVFNNIDECAAMTGAGQDRYVLATKMSAAFASFARTGDPNHAGLPHWSAFTTEQRATMIMDKETHLVNDPYGDERRALYAI